MTKLTPSALKNLLLWSVELAWEEIQTRGRAPMPLHEFGQKIRRIYPSTCLLPKELTRCRNVYMALWKCHQPWRDK